MTTKIDELLPSAGDFMKKLALAEAEEASKQARQARRGGSREEGAARSAT